MYQRQRFLPADSWLYCTLAAAYSLLLGLILPFICWGTLATPGHPHKVAHLVFLLPPAYAAFAAQNSASDHGLHPSEHGLHHEVQGSAATKPIGRSVPAQLVSAISIITPLFVVQILLLLLPASLSARLAQALLAHQFDPRVLTPPPRLSPS
jgi:hypothetical protein